MMVMTQISLPTSNGHAVKKVDNDMGSGDNNNNVHHHHDPDEGRATAADVQTSLKNVNFNGSNGSHAPEAQNEEPRNENNGDEPEESENGDEGDGDSEAESQEDFRPVAEPASAYASRHSSSTSHTPDDPSTAAKSPSRALQGQITQGSLQSASFQSSRGGEFHGQHQEHHTVLTCASHPGSQFLLTISAPSQSGHYESSEPGLLSSSYQQHQGSQIGEAPLPLVLANRDACQLPECVMKRANAGLSCAATGGAQLEHLLARVKHEKTMSRARAWEEGAKAKAHNRYTRDESKITAWENLKKAKAEARMSKAQEHLDKKRAKHFEKMKNAVASAHCTAQEKRAAMEARRAEEIVKAEEIASRIRATGKMPRRCLCMPF